MSKARLPGETVIEISREAESNELYRRNFPRLLQLFCEAEDISFAELARICAVSRRTVQRWTNGEMIPGSEYLYDMLVFSKRNGGVGLEYLTPDIDYLEAIDAEEPTPEPAEKKTREKPVWQVPWGA